MKETNLIPLTVEGAVDILFDCLEEHDREYILSTGHEEEVHLDFGMHLRNKWSLWRQDTPVSLDFQQRFKLFGHGDDLSGMILSCLWAKVYGVPIDEEAVAERYRKHWIKSGMNPETGKEISGD